jgi:SAM-dependent methyltransferase
MLRRCTRWRFPWHHHFRTVPRSYDTDLGRAVLGCEVECLRPLFGGAGLAVDVGTGTGRFAGALDIPVGVDPSAEMLRLAARRGVQAVRATGEALPFRDGACSRLLFSTVLEFVADPETILREAARVLRPDGAAVVGFLASSGPWAVEYRKLGEAGDPVFGAARFFSHEELLGLAARAGLRERVVRSTLFGGPAEPPEAKAVDGAAAGAGFIGTALVARA